MTRRNPVTRLLFLLFVLVGLSACNDTVQDELRVRVIADGREAPYIVTGQLTVDQFLARNNISVSPFDRLVPPPFTPVTDGMTITIVRVEERVECTEEDIPYETETMPNMDLEPNVTQVVLAGQNGRAKICFNVLYEDGVEKQRNRANYTILSQPINQIVAVGVDRSRIEPRTINGTIVYTSGGQARAISEYSLNQTALNTGGRLDGKVFALSENGRQLLFTRKSDDPELYNELWVLLDTANPEAEPVHLEALDNILSAEWVPGQPFTFTYSTLQPREGVPDYQALNDLFTARLDSTTGAILRTDAIVRVGPTGVYATYGTDFKWSPNGAQLAWAQPDGVGLVDLEEGTFTKLFDFRVYTTTLSRNWVWKPDLAWSADGSILSATVHGEPLNPGEERETSPVFDVAAMRIDGAFRIMELLGRTGMWAAPQFSPNGSAIAYLQARRPLDSVTSEYDLMIADRDGSNARAIFPGTTSAGIVPFNITGELFVWSPDGSEIAIVYGGDLYIIDIASGRATQVTLVGDAAHPRWVR